MLYKEFPILEFDEDRDAFIRPERQIKPIDISERAVLCFFSDAIKKVLSEYPHKIVGHLSAESMTWPIYEINYNNQPIVLAQAVVGAPMAAGHLEELTAYGCKKYIACGGCGVLQNDIAVGHLIVPVSAVRDEGTSYHYLTPSREVEMDGQVVKIIENILTRNKIPYIKGKTWTTDAFFRETTAKIKRRKEEGCIAVDMEASAFFAVAKYLNVQFGQLFYAGDTLGGNEWDSRKWQHRTDIRERVLKLSIDACLEL
jgi:uridine phosphorylase